MNIGGKDIWYDLKDGREAEILLNLDDLTIHKVNVRKRKVVE